MPPKAEPLSVPELVREHEQARTEMLRPKHIHPRIEPVVLRAHGIVARAFRVAHEKTATPFARTAAVVGKSEELVQRWADEEAHNALPERAITALYLGGCRELVFVYRAEVRRSEGEAVGAQGRSNTEHFTEASKHLVEALDGASGWRRLIAEALAALADLGEAA